MNPDLKLQDGHYPLCANRHRAVALVFVAFCALEVSLSWRAIGQKGLMSFDLLWNLVSIVLVAQFLSWFKCVRERLVFGLMIMRFAVGFTAKVAPELFAFSEDLLKRTNFALWAAALTVSLSMFYSSLRSHPLPGLRKEDGPP